MNDVEFYTLCQTLKKDKTFIKILYKKSKRNRTNRNRKSQNYHKR